MCQFDSLLSEIRSRNDYDDYFEKQFCIWFLENDHYWKTKIKSIWLWDDWPGRWGPDSGIDSVFETPDGEIWAVQSKCYDSKYQVSKRDIDKFISESGRPAINKRLLMATTNKIDRRAKETIRNQEKPVVSILLKDFQSSGVVFPSDLSALKGKTEKTEPPVERPYQKRAVDAVVKGFESSARGQLIMACGTGKTLITLWVKERLKPDTTLVLLPSLNLLADTLSEWTRQSTEPFEVLCVCSDQTVGKVGREEDISVADVPFDVTADEAVVSKFLKLTKPKVVFCTYQSSNLVGRAQNGALIDLAICDEAHRCAGVKNSAFTDILDDKKIKVRKRLFATATPRIYSSNVSKSAEARGIDLMGMSDVTSFGPQFFTYKFSEAIDDQWLTDYQVVVVGVNEATIHKFIKSRELVITTTGQILDASNLASKIALIKATADFDLTRVISFHNRIKSAKNFASEYQQVFGLVEEIHRPEGSMLADYVSGEMSAAERRLKIQNLRSLNGFDRALLANSRCLAEGVDVPALDGVAFIDPRGSEIDIVQAVGRALRLSKTKTLGTIILPIFLSLDEDVETYVESSQFLPVWNVLKALKSHDDVLSEELDEFRRSLGHKSGHRLRTGLTKVSIDLPQEVTSGFAAALELKIVEMTTHSWEQWFGEITEHLEENGSVPQIPDKKRRTAKGFVLADWCGQQRTLYNQGALPKERIESLESLPGWTWSPVFDRLMEAAKAVKDWCMANETWIVPDAGIMCQDLNLSVACKGARRSYASGNLPPEVVKIYETIKGWIWDAVDDRIWELKFDAYKTWHINNNQHLPPRDLMIDNIYGLPAFSLGNWVTQQNSRYYAKTGARRLESKEIERFENEIAYWAWSPWERSFKGLLYAIENVGLANISSRMVFDELPKEIQNVGRWLSKQKHHLITGNFEKSSKLKPEYLEKLKKTGVFVSLDPPILRNSHEHRWEIGFELLTEYSRENGTTRVPQGLITKNDFPLGSWVGINRHDSKLQSDDGEKRHNRLLELSDWYLNPADFRTVDYLAADDQTISELHRASESNEKLTVAILLALFAGLRLPEVTNFNVIDSPFGRLIEVPQTKGICHHRLIPCHNVLQEFEPINDTNTGALRTAFARIKPAHMPTEIHFTSFLLRFIEKLRLHGVSKRILFMVANGAEKALWSDEILEELSQAVAKIEYDALEIPRQN